MLNNTNISELRTPDCRGRYMVRRRPDGKTAWHYQIYERKLCDFAARGFFDVVVVADSDSPMERTIRIPYEYLQSHILPSASKDWRGRYLFEVSKTDLRFNWHHGVGMDGRRFLALTS